MFMAGGGGPQDLAVERRLLEQSANGGYRRATRSLAQHYAEVKGVERDPAKARELALRSAGSGDVESHLWLLHASRPGGVLGEDSGQSALLAEKLMADRKSTRLHSSH